MQKVRELLQHRKQNASKANSERAELVGYFADRLNTRQIALKKKPYSYAFIGMKLSIFRTDLLYALKSQCEQAQNWYATFWWHLKNPRLTVAQD